jgi:hypothetical protein
VNFTLVLAVATSLSRATDPAGAHPADAQERQARQVRAALADPTRARSGEAVLGFDSYFHRNA